MTRVATDDKLSAAGTVYVMVVGFVATMAAHVVRFGYDFGNSDQDELVPAVLRILSGNRLFENDWFVNYQTSTFSVRTPVITITAFLSELSTPFAAVLFLYAASAAVIFVAIYNIAARLGSPPLSPWLSCFTVFVLTKGFTLGGNDVIASMFVPSMLAWAAALSSLYFWLDDRPALAGILGGMAVPIQALVGLHNALLLTISGLILWIVFKERSMPRRMIRYLAAFAIVSVWPLFLIVSSQSSVGVSGVQGDPFLDILATIRAPHHFLPSAFPVSTLMRFGALAVAGIVSLAVTKQKDRQAHTSILLAIALCCACAYTFIEIWPTTSVVKLQLFKLTVYAKVLFILLVVNGVLTAADKYLVRVRERFMTQGSVVERLTSAPWLTVSIVTVSLALALLFVPEKADLQFHTRRDSDWGAVETWARDNTPIESTFMIPPSNAHFRSEARRAIFVNYKATPFNDATLIEWQTRIAAQMGSTTVSRGVKPAAIDDAFRSLLRSELAELATTHAIDFVVTEKTIDEVTPTFSAGDLSVYNSDSLLIQ